MFTIFQISGSHAVLHRIYTNACNYIHINEAVFSVLESSMQACGQATPPLFSTVSVCV